MSLNNIEENIGANVSIFECVCSGSNPQMSPFFSFLCCKCFRFLVCRGANVSIYWLVVVQMSMSPFFG